MTVQSVTQPKSLAAYSQVLVPVDFSPPSWRALALANRVARALGIPRRVVHVDTSSPWLDEGTHALVLRKGPSGREVKVDVVAERNATDGIVRILGDEDSPLLVMSTRGHTAAGELLAGSTTVSLLRRWDGPMLLAGPRFEVSPVPYRRIVVCVDPESPAVPAALAADIHALATAFGVPIGMLAVLQRGSSADFDVLLEENRSLESAAEQLASDERKVKLVRLTGARPGHEIARYVDASPGTIVALSTHARRPASRVIFGSTGMAVLRHVTSPMLVRRFPTR